MAIITLLTDLGLKDHYLAAVKGAILKMCPDARIVDISHQIEKYETSSAAFIIKNCFREFPEGTIHIIGVNDEAIADNPYLIVKAEGQYFIGADNGIFSLFLEELPAEVFKIAVKGESIFPLKEVFARVACSLANGVAVQELGEPVRDFTRIMELSSFVERDSIRGAVIYIDSYGNAITNITLDQFNKIRNGRMFSISIRADYEVREISKSYGQVPQGEIVAMFNSSENLVIAMNRASAANLLGLRHRTQIRVEFQ